MNQGAAVGVSPGEQCPQHQEAEREGQAVGQGAYGGRRGRVRGATSAAEVLAQQKGHQGQAHRAQVPAPSSLPHTEHRTPLNKADTVLKKLNVV